MRKQHGIRTFAPIILHLVAMLPLVLTAEARADTAEKTVSRPNVILILTDDQGYNDLGCFGSETIRTPHLDRMAREGIKLTSFYAQPACGTSRASLLTGCYYMRVAEPGNQKRPHTILHSSEVTIAEVLRDAGYRTMCIGKWHLAGSGGEVWERRTRRRRWCPAIPARCPPPRGLKSILASPIRTTCDRT